MTDTSPCIGIIMLNTDFPRPVGDIGNPLSFDYPCKILKLTHSNVANAVTDKPLGSAIYAEFSAAAVQLQSEGTSVIATSCGFLCDLHTQIQQQISIPFIPTSLVLIPFLRMMYPGRTLGVLTFDSGKLGRQHFCGHYANDIVIAGIESGEELHRVISRNEATLNTALAEKDVLMAADKLLEDDISCLLLECTNLSPYKAALRRHAGIPVFDLVDCINWIARSSDAHQV